eukprot:1191759-Prorocentrum_minimum.AAC.2
MSVDTSDGGRTEHHASKVNGSPPIWHGLLAGVIAGLTSRLIVHPADTLKAQLQISGALKDQAEGRLSTMAAFSKIASTEGIRGFYRGFGVVVLGAIPGNLCYFGGYELGKDLVRSAKQVEGLPISLDGFWGDAATGLVAQLVAGLAFTPMDLIKERMQVQLKSECGVHLGMMGGAYEYRSASDAFRQLMQHRGVLGLFKGYWITNSVWIPWNTIYIATYEASKREAAAHHNSGSVESLPAPAIVACAGVSAAVAAIVTNPIDVVKTRVQVLSGGKGAEGLRAGDVARSLWRGEGWRGLLAGSAARVVNIAPGCAISWFAYETVKSQLSSW